MVDRILSFAPFIGAGLAAIAGGALGYHRGVVIPRRKRKITKLEESTAVLRDLVNIQHIFVLQKESGLTIYDRAFSRIPLDPALVSGFIQAISSFGTELTESKEGTLKELTHENFTILINPGEYTMTALILSDHPSKKLRENIANFKSVFESQYQEKLIKWSGELKEFKGANEIVDQVFEFNLLKPQTIIETKLKSARLNDLQKDIIKLTNEILSANQTFNIVNLLNISLTMRKEDKLEIIDAVYKLAKMGVIKPYEPTSTDKSDLYI
jgi:hypothetical protein